MKLINVLRMNESIYSVIDTEIDVKLKFELLGVLSELSIIIDNYEKVRSDIFKKYGTYNTETNLIEVNKDNEDFNNAMNDLINTDVNVTSRIKADDILNHGIATNILVDLYNIIEM